MNIKDKLEEIGGGTFSFVGRPDARTGSGYGTNKQRMKASPVSADGFPYDIHDEVPGESELSDDPKLQKKFAKKVGQHPGQETDIDSYVSRGKDPFSYFDDNTVGLAESLLRETIQSILDNDPAIMESGPFRLKSRSSEPDGAVTQWGTRIPGGTQFGWSSGYPFKQDQDAYDPVFSLRDLMTKHEDEWQRLDGELEPEPEQEWKEEYGDQEYEKDFPLYW